MRKNWDKGRTKNEHEDYFLSVALRLVCFFGLRKSILPISRPADRTDYRLPDESGRSAEFLRSGIVDRGMRESDGTSWSEDVGINPTPKN